MWQCVAVCCGVCCSVCCSALIQLFACAQKVVPYMHRYVGCVYVGCVVVCGSVLQYVVVHYSVWQCAAVCFSALQCW